MNEGLELGDIFDPFYDRQEEYDELMRRLSFEQSQEDGSRPPIIFFEGISEQERKIVEWHRRKEERHLQKMLRPPEEVPLRNEYLIPYRPNDGIAMLSLLRRNSSKDEKKPNSYNLFLKVLTVCRLCQFQGKFYFANVVDTQNPVGQLRFVGRGDVFIPLTEGDVKSLVLDILETDIALCGRTNPLNQVMEFLGTSSRVKRYCTTEDINHVYFRNGCLNAVTGNFRPNTLEDFFIAYLDFDYPIGYVPATPHMDAFLNTASGGNPVWIETVLELLGYLMVPDTAAKHFYLLQGISDSGKSVLGDLISSLFNPEAVNNIDIFRLKDRFSTGNLEGCRINISMDLSDGKVSNEAVAIIKMLTRGDGITTERKFKDAKPQKLDCKLVFGSNYPLLLSKPDEAFTNRLVHIPFLYAIPKEQQDPYLREKLRQERPGIAVKAIAAYQRLRQRNYQFPELRIPGTSGIYGYVPMAEILEAFVTTCCEFSDESCFTPTSVLLAAFNQFCDLNGAPAFQDSAQFSRQLNQFCAGKVRKDKQRVNGVPTNGYWGIRLK